jgi:hypothetical protein
MSNEIGQERKVLDLSKVPKSMTLRLREKDRSTMIAYMEWVEMTSGKKLSKSEVIRRGIAELEKALPSWVGRI